MGTTTALTLLLLTSDRIAEAINPYKVFERLVVWRAEAGAGPAAHEGVWTTDKIARNVSTVRPIAPNTVSYLILLEAHLVEAVSVR